MCSQIVTGGDVSARLPVRCCDLESLQSGLRADLSHRSCGSGDIIAKAADVPRPSPHQDPPYSLRRSLVILHCETKKQPCP